MLKKICNSEVLRDAVVFLSKDEQIINDIQSNSLAWMIATRFGAVLPYGLIKKLFAIDEEFADYVEDCEKRGITDKISAVPFELKALKLLSDESIQYPIYLFYGTLESSRGEMKTITRVYAEEELEWPKNKELR